MLEATMVLVVTMFTVYLLISMGFLLYEKYIVQLVADDVASKVAQSYRSLDADLSTGRIPDDKFASTSLYRYGPNSRVAEDFKNRHIDPAIKYAKKHLELMTLSILDGINIEIEIKPDGIGRNHVEVTINVKNRVLLSEFLALINMKQIQNHSATSSADCLDLIDYCNTVVVGRRICDTISKSSETMNSINFWIKKISGSS